MSWSTAVSRSLSSSFFVTLSRRSFRLRARFGAVHHVVQTRPRRFERLERSVVHDRVELLGQQLVDFGDAFVDHRDDALVRARAHAFVENLRGELADQFLRVACLANLRPPCCLPERCDRAGSVRRQRRSRLRPRLRQRFLSIWITYESSVSLTRGMGPSTRTAFCRRGRLRRRRRRSLPVRERSGRCVAGVGLALNFFSSSVFCTMRSSIESSSSLPSSLASRSRSC